MSSNPATGNHPTMSRPLKQPDPAVQASVVVQQPQQSLKSDVPPNWAELEAKYKQDIEALTESTEMATIEKEIAEEKLDSKERELQDIKDQLAEATLQIDALRREQQNEPRTQTGTSDTTVTVLQLQKVEEQNDLLKQALIKLRDMSANDKRALEDLQIKHEELEIKVLDLEDKEQKYLEQIKIYEEQIDVSQSAQEMVEKLTQEKADLEDKLKEIVDDLDCMEKLRDLNEQLLENARETEIELTNELEKLRAQYVDLNHKKRDMEDYLSDQERTVSKLRDENRTLNEDIIRLRDQFKEGESLEVQKHQIENVAYKLNFSETKMAEKEAEVARLKRNLAEVEEQMNNLSSITKEQSTRLDDLKMQYEAKVGENAELQRALKKKMEEVSELEIRRDMAEKKLQSTQKDKDSKIANLVRQIETMKGIEVQHEEDMKRLMEDNEIIERERRELRDQLNRSNRSLERTMQTGNTSMVTAQDSSLASLGISLQPSTPVLASPPQSYAQPLQSQQQHISQLNQCIGLQPASTGATFESPSGPARRLFVDYNADESVLLSKLRDLSVAFNRATRRIYELETELAFQTLNKKPTPHFASADLSSHYDIDRAKSLQLELSRLKREVRAAIINQKICTKSRNIHSETRNDRFNQSRLALKYQALENEANTLVSSASLTRFRPNVPLLQSTPVK